MVIFSKTIISAEICNLYYSILKQEATASLLNILYWKYCKYIVCLFVYRKMLQINIIFKLKVAAFICWPRITIITHLSQKVHLKILKWNTKSMKSNSILYWINKMTFYHKLMKSNKFNRIVRQNNIHYHNESKFV